MFLQHAASPKKIKTHYTQHLHVPLIPAAAVVTLEFVFLHVFGFHLYLIWRADSDKLDVMSVDIYYSTVRISNTSFIVVQTTTLLYFPFISSHRALKAPIRKLHLLCICSFAVFFFFIACSVKLSETVLRHSKCTVQYIYFCMDLFLFVFEWANFFIFYLLPWNASHR